METLHGSEGGYLEVLDPPELLSSTITSLPSDFRPLSFLRDLISTHCYMH